MSIDELLSELRLRHCWLVSPYEVYPYDARLARALRRHRQGVQLLFAWCSTSVCPTPRHQPYYDYRHGRFICTKCQELLPEVSA